MTASAFQVRDWTSYTQTMASWIASNPGLVPGFNMPSDMQTGSLERAHLEAIAVVMEDYDVRADGAVEYAINNAVYNAFGFPALSAIASTSAVVFSALVAPAVNIDIPTGTKVATASGVQFVTIQDATLSAGAFSSAAVPVQAATPGVAGNVPAASLARILYPIAGIDSVTNGQATVGGADAETDAARSVRFQSWINTLVRGTKEALEYAAINASGASVVDALAVEPFLLIPAPAAFGNVWLFIDDGLGTGTFTPLLANGTIATATSTSPVTVSNQTLIAKVLNGGLGPNNTFIPGWKAAGISVTLKPVPLCPVYLTAAVTTATSAKGRFAAIQTALTNAALTVFNSVTIGETVSFHQLLVALSIADPDIMSVNLQMGTAPGSYIAPGIDIAWNPNDPIQVGSRFTMENGLASDNNTYPLWNLS